jgi:hypothetical protein
VRDWRTYLGLSRKWPARSGRKGCAATTERPKPLPPALRRIFGRLVVRSFHPEERPNDFACECLRAVLPGKGGVDQTPGKGFQASQGPMRGLF